MHSGVEIKNPYLIDLVHVPQTIFLKYLTTTLEATIFCSFFSSTSPPYSLTSASMRDFLFLTIVTRHTAIHLSWAHAMES